MAAVVGVGALAVGGVVAALALHERNRVNEETERERRNADDSMARGSRRFDELVHGDGMLVADAATRLLGAHDVNRDGVLSRTLSSAHALSGRGEVDGEWQVWSQKVWPWQDPEAHLVQLIPNRAPRTNPVEVGDGSPWLGDIAGNDAEVSRSELRAFVESFDADGDDVLRGDELSAFGERIGEPGYVADFRGYAPLPGPFTPAAEMAARLVDQRQLSGYRSDGVELDAHPQNYRTPDLWEIDRSPTRAERAAGIYGDIEVATGLSAEQVQERFVAEGVDSVYRTAISSPDFAWDE